LQFVWNRPPGILGISLTLDMWQCSSQ
jgi:hypothetical protein